MRSSTKNSEGHQPRPGRAIAPYEYVGNRLHCAETDQWLTDWDVISALKIEGPWVRENLLPSPTVIAPIREKNSFGTTNPSISYRKFSSIIILWDHRPIYGLLLTETLLRGAWLYIILTVTQTIIQIEWLSSTLKKHLIKHDNVRTIKYLNSAFKYMQIIFKYFINIFVLSLI